jgi:hypothetical protein
MFEPAGRTEFMWMVWLGVQVAAGVLRADVPQAAITVALRQRIAMGRMFKSNSSFMRCL